MSFTLDNLKCVNRNSSQENELWKAIADDIEKHFIEMSKSSSEEDRRIPISVVASDVLGKPEYLHLHREDYINLLLGCGCCRRHSKGILPCGKSHVNEYNTSKPTTRTLEGKPCDCSCRIKARFMISSMLEEYK